MDSGLDLKHSSLISGSPIAGTVLHKLTENIDPRGSFTEVFQKQWNSCIDPVQWSIVKSEPGVLRGMHYHKRHDEYFCIIEGTCLVGLKDLRPDSESYGAYSLYKLNSNGPAAITFPSGILHGWYFIEKSIHLQAVSESYEDYSSDDNLGCRWDDSDLGIPWPFDDATISERAKNFSTLNELKDYLQIL